MTVLSKSLRPLPVVKYKDGVAYDGFNDPELRYRQRYVDLVVNEGVKDIFMKRAAIIKTMRTALDEAGYTEVETPILTSVFAYRYRVVFETIDRRWIRGCI